MNGVTARDARAILVIRLSAIGDVVMATPLIRALREGYPQAHIAWLLQPEAAALLAANPRLTEVIVWPRGAWRKLFRERHWLALAREVTAFVKDLRGRRFDLVIDAQGLLKSALWARLSGAPTRIGLASREGSAPLMTRVVEPPVGDKHMGAEYRHLLRALGLPHDVPMDLALALEDRGFAQDFILREGLSRGYAVLCPFTTRPQKHWVEARWAELAGRLREDLGLPAVVLGGAGDSPAAARMLAAAPDRFLDMTGRTTLRQAAALVARAALLVGVDTALSHMGTAFRVPSVVLLGSTCPYLTTDSDRTAVVYKGLACAPCKRRPTCGGRFDCMRLIAVDEVMQHAGRVLAGRPRA